MQQSYRYATTLSISLSNLVQIFPVSSEVCEVLELQVKRAKLSQDGAAARRPPPVLNFTTVWGGGREGGRCERERKREGKGREGRGRKCERERERKGE